MWSKRTQPNPHDRPLVVSAVSDPQLDAPASGEEAAPLAVHRAFAFVDICAFTTFCDRHGEQAALQLLTQFRALTREVVGRRGVRVSKWLGDGVMLVSTDAAPLAAATVELEGRCRAIGIDTHGGLAAGPVLMFEGDDYVGRTVNLAARLCDAAGKGEVLAVDVGDGLPDWVRVKRELDVALPGMGRVEGVAHLTARADIDSVLRAGHSAA